MDVATPAPTPDIAADACGTGVASEGEDAACVMCGAEPGTAWAAACCVYTACGPPAADDTGTAFAGAPPAAAAGGTPDAVAAANVGSGCALDAMGATAVAVGRGGTANGDEGGAGEAVMAGPARSSGWVLVRLTHDGQNVAQPLHFTRILEFP